MYSFDILPEAREQADALPAKALPCYAELLVFLELTPWAGSPYKDDEPEGNMRTQPLDPPVRAWLSTLCSSRSVASSC